MRTLGRLAPVFLVLIFLSACGGGSSAPANISPTANAGADQSVDEQTDVTLTGTASDSDGTVASTTWTQVSGTSVTINSATSTTATFTAPPIAMGSEILVFRLTVKDDKGASSSDDISITNNTTNAPPVADAGADFAADEQTTVTLTGSASDSDGSVVTANWSQVSGTTVTLTILPSVTIPSPVSFTAPSLSAPENLVFSLTVTDDRGVTNTDNITVTINPVAGLNTAPVANAGPDQSVVGASKVNLDGTGSTDPDGSIASYSWQQTVGTAVSLTGPNTALPGFDAPAVAANEILTFQLTVTDNEGATHSDLVDITVTPVPAQTKITGTVTFDRVPFGTTNTGLDYSNITKTPVVWATVEAISNSVVVASTITDTLGKYSLTVDPNIQLFIRVKAEMKKTGTPSRDVEVVDNTKGKAIYAMDGSSVNSGVTDLVVDLNADSGWTGAGYGNTRVAAPFALLHSAFVAMQKVLEANANHNFTSLKINWSVNNKAVSGDKTIGQITTSHYIQNELFILGDANSDTDEYDDHVIIHEWGHYFEDNFSRADSIGGGHGGGDRLDMRVALGEGWGNAWSGMATDDPVYRDSNGAGQGSDFQINVDMNNNANPGWYSEGSAQSILYDLYDAGNDGADNISMGITPIYNVLIDKEKNTPALTSIFSFIKALKDENPSDAAAIDTLVTDQNINGTDEWGTGESNDAMATTAADVLPVYGAITTNGTMVNVCSNPEFKSSTGVGNKLGTYQFLRFEVATAGSYRVQLNSATGTDPDYYLYENGILGAGLSPNDGTETGTHNLKVGTHVITIDDDKVITGDKTTRSCIDVSITQL